MNYNISLLHATRSRSEKALACRALWLSKAARPELVEHIFAIDDDDVDSLSNINTNRVIVPRGKGSVQAWNAAAEKSKGEILIQLSDDWIPSDNWDTAIINEFYGCIDERVLAISDGHRKDDLLCMAILNRARYNKQGFLFHPEFFSVFSDDFFTWAAKKDGVIKEAKHIVFEHAHPIFGKAEMDATYARSNSQEHYINGHAIFNKLTRQLPSTICLAMIVKNEINTIENCLTSLKDYINYWVICDTGSTDGTQDLITKLMNSWGIKGELIQRPWVDFAHNRTESLNYAKGKADYTLIIDADDRLEVKCDPRILKELNQDAYHLQILHGGLSYTRAQIIRNEIDWRYAGVLHEFLQGPPDTRIGPPVVLPNVIMHARASEARDGYAGAKKYLHDATVLEKALLSNDLDDNFKRRYTFYLAQSYRDAVTTDNSLIPHMAERAIHAYNERAKMGGWDEEVYYSLLVIARLKLISKKEEEDIINSYIKAWENRPSRVEALFELIVYLYNNKRFAFAYALSSLGIRTAPTRDSLFVSLDIVQWRMADMHSILAMATGNKAEAARVLSLITNSPHFNTLIPESDRNRIVENAKICQTVEKS